MHISVDVKSMSTVLSVIGKLTGADHANIEVVGQDILCSATGNNKSVRMTVEGDVTDAGEGFGFNIFTVSQLFKGRKKFEMRVTDNKVQFRSATEGSKTTAAGKFAGDFQPLPFENIDVVSDDDVTLISVNSREQQALQESVDAVRLNNLFNNEPLNLFVRQSKDGLFATVFDDYHVAFSHDPSVQSKKNMDFSLPLPLFDTIALVSGGADYTIKAGPAYVNASGVGFELSLPTLQVRDNQNFDMAQGLATNVKDLPKVPSLTIAKQTLSQILDSMAGLNTGTSFITIGAGRKGKTQFSITSSFGSAKEELDLDVKCWDNDTSFNINPSLVGDILAAHQGPQVTLYFRPKMLMIIDESAKRKVTYSSLLV